VGMAGSVKDRSWQATTSPLQRFEVRNSKIRTKVKIQKSWNAQSCAAVGVLDVLEFGIRVCFGFRISSFGFGTPKAWVVLPGSARASGQPR